MVVVKGGLISPRSIARNCGITAAILLNLLVTREIIVELVSRAVALLIGP